VSSLVPDDGDDTLDAVLDEQIECLLEPDAGDDEALDPRDETEGVKDYLRTTQPPTPPRKKFRPEPEVLETSAGDAHPLVKLLDEVEAEEEQPSTPTDHGTWPGDLPMPSRSEFIQRMMYDQDNLCGLLPFPSSKDVYAE
jgi:hypothetical protein